MRSPDTYTIRNGGWSWRCGMRKLSERQICFENDANGLHALGGTTDSDGGPKHGNHARSEFAETSAFNRTLVSSVGGSLPEDGLESIIRRASNNQVDRLLAAVNLGDSLPPSLTKVSS
jgi:hypothetical protein